MSAVNPKDVEAQKTGKAQLDLLEPVADEAIAQALAFGASKYGVRNYVESPIQARVYVAAIRRHVAAWLSGEDIAEDSGLHHLAHIGANVHVALAAMAAGSFVDDRHGKADEPSNDPPSWDELTEEPLVEPGSCPFRGLPNGGVCSMADQFDGFENCRQSCEAAERTWGQ